MPLTAGTHLGPYEIQALLGAGGMGEVYKATDTRLDRTVAIKVSKTEFSQRFEREARAIAALNHPNICTLYDVGPNYLVMEYVEGAELKGPLPLPKALDLASQILDAIDAAHRKGITHRDLKPANILITKTGIKVLDFGLAKMERQSAFAAAADAPTVISVEGTISGTLYYMAPEQLQGNAEVDARADIFAFGCVLYELLTGKRAFDGASAASVIAAVMERPAPSIEAIAPPALDRVLKKCLSKEPGDRWQNALDLKAALDLAVSLVPGAGVPGPVPKSTRHRWLWGATVLAAIASLGAGVWYGRSTSATTRQAVRFQIPVQPTAGIRPIGAISPDGRSLAYFDVLPDGGTAIKIRSMDSAAITEFPGTETAKPVALFWSPDSKAVYFSSRQFLKRVEVAHSRVQTVCECSSDSGSINQDGIILLGNAKSEIMRVSAAGESVTLRKRADSNRSPSSPTFLPDGHRYLFLDSGGIFLASLDRPQDAPRRIVDAGNGFALAAGSAGSYLLVNQPNEIDVFPFDARRGAIDGPPGTLTSRRAQVRPALSVSNTGILLRPEAVETQQNIVWFDAQGKPAGDLGSVAGYAGIDFSHDGKRIAILESGFSPEIDIRDLERGTITKLARKIRPEGITLWSPDDSSLVFDGRDNTGILRVYRADSNNTRPASVLLEGPGLHWPNDWSRDGKYLLYGLDEDKTSRDLWVLPMYKANAKPFQYTHGVVAVQGQFSPDTRFVAYASDESGRFEIVVQTFPDPSKGKWVISQAGGVEPRWSKDGHQLFFFSGQKLMVVDVREMGDLLTASAPRDLFSAPIPPGFNNDSHRWQLSPDGSRFVLLVPSAGAATASLDVMVNWEQMLKR